MSSSHLPDARATHPETLAMFRRTICLTLVVLFVCAGAAPAQKTALDLIPTNADAAVAIRNIADLKKKCDQFVKDYKIKSFEKPSERPSELITLIFVTTRLCLVGEAALPYREKALKSRDAEVRKRAERTKDAVQTAA